MTSRQLMNLKIKTTITHRKCKNTHDKHNWTAKARKNESSRRIINFELNKKTITLKPICQTTSRHEEKQVNNSKFKK